MAIHNRPHAARTAGVLAALLIVGACGSSGGSPTTPVVPPVTPPVVVPIYSAADAARLADQGSFGATKTLVDAMVASGGAGAWVDAQVAATPSNYNDLVAKSVAKNYCDALSGTARSICDRDYRSSFAVALEFYAHAVANPDQLRQRVAFALSQLLVASDFEVHSTSGLASLNQIYLDNAFGNYRDILKAVTLNGYMGDYLDLAGSSKAAPNENYARELMQLFAMGVNQLNADGTDKLDSTGATIATFTADDVRGVARALTGWTYARLNGSAITDNNNIDYAKPMIQYAALYDTTAKTFLGTTVAASATQDASLNAVIDAVFNNASTAPYVSKFLIQQLVTSNPSAAYVGRISAIFANNGSGVRGDLKAVIRAILTDADARGDAKTGASDGKLKEPVLFATAIARLAGFRSDGYAFYTRDQALGQQPFRAPSVFNFYPPDYPLPQGGGLVSPPTKLLTVSTVLARHNLAYDWFVSGDAASRSEYTPLASLTGATGTQPDWSAWEAFGTDTSGLIDRINLLMLNNTMSSAQRASLVTAINAVTNADATTQARKRAQVALYIVASSPQFQVDR